MKIKTTILVGSVLIAASAGYFFYSQQRSPQSPITTPNASQEQIQNSVQDMIKNKAERKSLQTQLAVYQRMSSQFPDSIDLQNRIKTLKQRISELE